LARRKQFYIFFFSYNSRKKEYPAFRYRLLSGGSFENPKSFLQLLLAVALDRRQAWNRVPQLNHLSSPYTLTNHKGRCMSHIISMHRPIDPRQTAFSDLSKIIPCLVAPKFEHSTLAVCAKQHNHSAIAAIKPDKYKNDWSYSNIFWLCVHILICNFNRLSYSSC
jgi:hypothetical protein